MLTEASTRSARMASDFWRYWTGSTISILGTGITTVALPLTAVEVVHASTFDLGMIVAAGDLPWLVFGLPAGVLVSKVPLRAAQVSMDLLRAVTLGTIPVAYWLGVLSVAQLVLAAFIVGIASVFFGVGDSTMVRSLVPADQLMKRNSQLNASSSAATLVGPGIGGLLVQIVGAATCMLADAVSYVVAAVVLWSLPRPVRLPSASGRTGLLAQIREGLGYVVRHPVISRLVLFTAMANFVGGALITLTPLFLIRVLHEAPVVVGLVYAGEGAGGAIGAVVATKLTRLVGTARIVLMAALIIPLAIGLVSVGFAGWGALLPGLGFAVFAGGMVVFATVSATFRQTSVPAELLPRVLATARFISWGIAPVGALFGGVTGAVLGIRSALFLLVGVSLSVPLVVWSSRRLRAHRDLEEIADAVV